MLDNSTIQHPLPGDLQARVENALNLVTSLEAEHLRYEKLISSQRSQINVNHEEIRSLEERIKNSSSQLSDLAVHISSRNEELNKLGYSIKDANHELEEAHRQKIEITNYIASKTAEIEQQISQANANDEAVHARHEELKKKEETHQKKVERLLEALK